MAEIKAIIEREDIAALVVLHTKGGYSEYLNHITPSYSCVKWEYTPGLGMAFRIRLKLEDFDGNKNRRDKQGADTANMLMHLSMAGGEQLSYLKKMSETIDNLMNSEHEEGGNHTAAHISDN